MVLIGVLVLGVLAAAGWGASRLPGGDQPGVTSTTPVTAASTPIGPTPQQVVRPLPVAAITASRTADGIRFTWTYDEPAAGDRFYVVRSDVENPKAVWPKESSITIVDDEACIEVTIYRANGQGGPAKRACYP